MPRRAIFRKENTARFLLLLAALLLMAALLEWSDWSPGVWQEKFLAINPALLLALMALLPVFGFSIGIVYTLAGLKFGPLWGGLVVLSITPVHLLLSRVLARTFLQKPVLRWLKKRGHSLPAAPPGREKSAALLVALVPGLPYALRNHGLALSAIPLRTYFWICVLVYTLRSFVTLLIGHWGNDPSLSRAGWVAAVFVLKLSVSLVLIQRLRSAAR